MLWLKLLVAVACNPDFLKPETITNTMIPLLTVCSKRATAKGFEPGESEFVRRPRASDAFQLDLARLEPRPPRD
jgi:hypothetical protein